MLALVFGAAMAFGCGDNGVGGGTTGSIQANPESIGFGHIDVGDSAEEIVQLRNTSETEELRIYSIELDDGDGGHVDQLEIIEKPDTEAVLQPQESVDVRVEYSPTADSPTNHGELLVGSSDGSLENSTLVVPVNTMGNEPEFHPDPAQVRFQRMQPGENTTQTLHISNIGNGPLTIFEEPTYSGGEDFHLDDINAEFPLELLPYDSEAVVDNPEDYVLEVDVIYAPLGDGDETGVIQVETDDVDDPPADQGDSYTHEVDVLADAEAPCIEVEGRTRDFGQVPLGERTMEQIMVSNCGTEDLELYDVVLEDAHHDDDDQPVYALELGTWDQSGDESIDGSVVLQPDETDSFHVEFAPENEGTRNAELLLLSNDPIQPEMNIALTARGAEGTCPTAVATAVVDGTPTSPASSITAAPLDTVVLDGTDSSDEDGDVIDWQWEVLQTPPGTSIDLEEREADGSVMEFEPAAAGEYEIGLDVLDDSGFHSCNQALVEVTVIPEQSIHIELTWNNPSAPDGAEDGSDMDIHLVKMGPGTWWDTTYSVFFLNTNSDGEDIWGPEDPSLDIDVRDGEGPENITMDTPDHCQWYAVGAHYYDPAGFGTAYNTVRIYINGNLRYERAFFPLTLQGEFWDVARIHWDDTASDATILGVDEFYSTMPYEQDPEVTDEMVNHDPSLCTTENLY